MSSYVCPECGLDYDTISPSDAAVAVRSYPRRFRAALTSVSSEPDDPDDVVRRKPDERTWSALEYTAHVRDVFAWMADVVSRTATEDHPAFEWVDQDRLAVERRYNSEDPAAVLDRLDSNSAGLAGAIESTAPDSWTRTASFPWGDRDALTMVRNAVHEGYHHLRDVEQVLASVSAR